MACIKTLNKAITYGCQVGAVGIAELYLINFGDITSATISADNEVTAVALRSGAKTIPVDCYKNGGKVVEALKGSDVANGLDQSISFVLYDKAADSRAIIAALLSGRFIAAVKLKDISALPILVGYRCGLEVSQLDTDSSANGGFASITIKTPEDARGEGRLTINGVAWNTITAAKLS